MKALVFDGKLSLRELPAPNPGPGDVLIRVVKAGICNTDLEITRGFVPGFDGTLGHEFFGVVAEADDPGIIGKRVTAGINCGCGVCDSCRRGLERHCPNRTVIGIVNRDGCFAEQISVPRGNVVEIPPGITDSQAIFIEPLAAALEIPAQVSITPAHSVLLLGDGKLAQLIARVLATTGCGLTVVGKHAWKLAILDKQGIDTAPLASFGKRPFDVVIEATGSAAAFGLAVECVKPRGTLVLKSTYAHHLTLNPAPIVVNEITVVGSRCGKFADALAFLSTHNPDFSALISGEFPLEEAVAAMERAARADCLKVVLRMS